MTYSAHHSPVHTPKDPICLEDKFWILNQKQEILERVVVRLKCRVLSHYQDDPRFETMIFIDKHQIILKEFQKSDFNSDLVYVLAIVKDGVTIHEYHHYDIKTVLKWKEKLECCSKEGSFFWRYREVENICRTPTSEVFKVQNLQDFKIYAAKTFKIKKIEMASIENEVRILRRLEHTSLVQLHEVYVEKKSIILIMDYLNGGDLAKKIAKCKSYKEDKAAKLMKNLFEIVKYLEDQSLVHKDIKPTNILLCNDSNDTNIKLIDFGLSSYTYSPTVNLLSGTPGYMAPEILRDQEVTIKYDMYACGLVLYFILTGLPAFCGIDIERRIQENYDGNISFDQLCWKNVSEECKSILRALLAKNPKDRPTPTQALKSAWIKKYCSSSSNSQNMSNRDHRMGETSPFHSSNFDALEKFEKQSIIKIKLTDGTLKMDMDHQEKDAGSSKKLKNPSIFASMSLFVDHDLTNTTFTPGINNNSILKINQKEEEEDYTQDIDENSYNLDLFERSHLAKFIKTLGKLNANNTIYTNTKKGKCSFCQITTTERPIN